MIIGVDIGNYATKTSQMISFPSKASTNGNILKNIKVTTDTGTYYIGEGSYDTEYRKAAKVHLMDFILYAITQSTNEQNNKIVAGLPLSQYSQDKDVLKETILSSRIHVIEVNNCTRKIFIENAEAYPEGVAATLGTKFEGVVVDIGGRTTDCCVVSEHDGKKKVSNPFSLPMGTLNLYSDFIKSVNAKYCLDLRQDDADRIIRNGLCIDGCPVDCSFAADAFKEFVENLVNSIQVEYSLRTQNIALVGGGCQLLYKAIKNRIAGARLIDNPVFANAIGFKKVGEMLWQ